MERTGRSRDKSAIDAANLEALDREMRAALALAQGRGLLAVNVMRAVGAVRGLRAPVLRKRHRTPSSWAPACRSTCRS